MWNDMCGKGSGKFITGQDGNIAPDIVTVTSAIGCLDKFSEEPGNMAMIDNVFKDAVERQIIFPKDTMDTQFEIDLSGMSFPVARAACRYIINQLMHEENILDLSLITGIGKHHLNDQSNSTTLREFVQEVLESDFDPPLNSKSGGGSGIIVVSKEAIQSFTKKALEK